VPADRFRRRITDIVLVKRRSVHAAWRRKVCGSERRARPTARRDVEDKDASVVWCALATADDDDLASDESRGAHAARRWQVSLHHGMGPVHHLCDSGIKVS